MADDARTEARRRLVKALAAHRWAGASCSCGVPLPTGIDGHLADVVLGLFPEVRVYQLVRSGLGAGPGWIVLSPADAVGTHRQFILTGPVEPITEEGKA